MKWYEILFALTFSYAVGTALALTWAWLLDRRRELRIWRGWRRGDDL